MKVVVTDFVEPDLDWEAGEASRSGFRFECHQLLGAPEADVVAVTRDADVVVVNHVRVTAGLIAGWEKCRLVIRHGVGYDSADLDALKRAGIRLCYIPDYCTEDVAEHAIALLLACARKLGVARRVFDDGVRSRRWEYSALAPLPRVAGRKVGIIGCGRIGSRVYGKLQSFGVSFAICDPYLSERRRRELGIEPSGLETVLREADFVTIHTPLTRETRHMIDRQTLALMKRTAFLVNTARGAIVDSAALAEALRNGTIGGAGLDVLDQEPPAADNPLLGLPNVLLTPHSAWYSEEAALRIRELIMLEIARFAEGLPPRYSAV